jgi:hypothetical protein
MSSQNRNQGIFLGILLLLLAVVSSALVITLQKQKRAEAKGTSPAILSTIPYPTTSIAPEVPTQIISPEAHEQLLAEMEAIRMLAAEDKKRAAEQAQALTALNERLERQNAARLAAEQQANELRNRLEKLAQEMSYLDAQRQALANQQQRLNEEKATVAEDPSITAKMDLEKQRLQELTARRLALEAEVSAAEKQHQAAIETQIEIEEAIIQRGGTITIRAPHDRRRDAVRLRDQMRQSGLSD